MKTIWKYELSITDVIDIEMPDMAEILSVQMQFDKPCLWVLVDSERKLYKHRIRIYGTGNKFDIDNYDFIGTIQVYGGKQIYHVFEDRLYYITNN